MILETPPDILSHSDINEKVEFRPFKSNGIPGCLGMMTPNRPGIHSSLSKTGYILVVDDEKYNCDVIYGLMGVLNVDKRKEITEFCYNGQDAVKKVQESIYDCNSYKYSLIIMDSNMPFMDGYDAAKHIRKSYAGIGISREHQPLIVGLSGHVEQEYQERGLNAGMDKLFSKPLQFNDFANLLVHLKYIDPSQIPQQQLA